jgi:SAM-dependent methyltransferase
MTGPIANVDAARAWNEEGMHWAEYWEQYEAPVRPHTDRLLTAARIGNAERVLDIGCGAGQTTREAARAAAGGEALGLDISTPLVARATDITAAEGPANARFVRGDAQVYPFASAEFDVAMSRFGAMFFNDPVAAFTNIARALRSNGRLALMSWQALDANDWLTSLRAAVALGRTLPTPPPDAPSPFSLADPERVAHILTAAGFDDIELEALELPFEINRNVADTIEFLTSGGPVKGMLDGLDHADRQRAITGLRATLTAHEHDGVITFGSAVWLVRARRAS